ncbi:hypothetical protein BDZ91DRAFT_661682, partial [Kalaharituber pfeilii]
PTIVPLPQITPETLQTCSPLQWRPYKPSKYHLTMGLSALESSKFIQIDNGYPKRIAMRGELIEKYPNITYGFREELIPAVEEFYEYLLGYYLPKRWPGIFRVIKNKGLNVIEEEWFENLVTGATYPVIPPTKRITGPSAEQADAVNGLLRAIGTSIEEDVFMLLPDSPSTGAGQYVLGAFCACFPSGFDASEKIGKPLAGIHDPVPGYQEKLRTGMDRFFAKVSVGKPWRRWNWTINTHNELFLPSGNEIYEREIAKPEPEDFDPSKVGTLFANLRVEYQTLQRLPKTRSLVFTVRTYLTPLESIRNNPPPTHAGTEDKPEPGFGTPNGRGGPEDLADAIEGIAGGMAGYKKLHRWAPGVVNYLRTGEKYIKRAE